MKRIFGGLLLVTALAGPALAKEETAKFYDFSDQLIDGEIKKPTALYTDSRSEVRFTRLLSLKKTFLPVLLQTSKERVFK
jgi:hypothetical protein